MHQNTFFTCSTEFYTYELEYENPVVWNETTLSFRSFIHSLTLEAK